MITATTTTITETAMPRILAFFLWSTVFCLLLMLIDQYFVRIPQRQPAMVATRQFYVDFRQRLFALGKGVVPPPSIEALIEKERKRPATSLDQTPAAAATKAATTPPSSPPAVKELQATPTKVAQAAKAGNPDSTTTRPAAAGSSGYVYADASGALQIVERLDQIPSRFRSSAQPLAQ